MRLALDQAPDAGGLTANLTRLASVARRAAAAGAHLLACPEMSLTGYNIGEDTRRLAQDVDGAAAEHVARIAAETGIAILHGFPERDGAEVYNTARIVDVDGTAVATYRKTHLFGDLDRCWFSPGDHPVVQTTVAGVRLGLLVCYDVEFPEMVRAHALAGTEMLLVPTALMRPHDFVAETLVPARAYENHLYLAYVNRCGWEGELDYCGKSCVITPVGTELVRGGGDEQLLLADIDPATVRTAREDNPHLRDRRPDLYPGTSHALRA
ncbi:carbon-nitrogen hydrolase family protein [Parasphingorhabdus pacifica]